MDLRRTKKEKKEKKEICGTKNELYLSPLKNLFS